MHAESVMSHQQADNEKETTITMLELMNNPKKPNMIPLTKVATRRFGYSDASSYAKSSPCRGSPNPSSLLLEAAAAEAMRERNHDRRTTVRFCGNMKKNPPTSLRGSEGLVRA